jgi:drug/metabolite transporter (DMT)-like permease
MFALIPTVVSSVCFMRAMRYIAPGVVAMVLTLEVALVIIWSHVFLDERVKPVQLLGAVVVIAGVLAAQWVNSRGAKEAAASLASATPAL